MNYQLIHSTNGNPKKRAYFQKNLRDLHLTEAN